MSMPHLLAEICAARDGSGNSHGRKAVLERFRRLVEELTRLSALPEPEISVRTRSKVQSLLAHIEKSHETLGPRLLHVAFSLNVVGEGMVRTRLICKSVVDFLQVGLYFYGLEQIERRWSAQQTTYSAIHVDHLTAFLGRKELKGLCADASAKIEEGRIFCMTYAYLNGLRKEYWRRSRASKDALDVARSATPRSEGGEGLLQGISAKSDENSGLDVGSRPDEHPPPSAMDRVEMMLDIFARALTPQQRWIYLAKNRSALFDEPDSNSQWGIDADLLAAFMGERSTVGGAGGPTDGESKPAAHNLGWSEISQRLGINEKTAKREYLRSMYSILQESSQAVFGDAPIPSNYVRRILEQIRTVVAEKDLRLKSSTGRGLGVLVEKWEVALRFVLNHERVVA